MKTRQAQTPSASRPHNAPPPSAVLPNDLIVEILSCLPVKSLLRFRCVCKLWKFVISNPCFVKLHLHNRSASKANLLLYWINGSLGLEYAVPCSVSSLAGNPSYNIDEDDCYPLNNNNGCRFPLNDNGDRFLGSCNGLVCLLDFFHRNTFVEYCFYLCNPATKLTSKKLACLRVSNYYRFAFGYDNLSDTYKVLAFRLNGKAKEESQKMQVKICSLGDNCWRNIHSFPAVPFITYHFPGRNDGVYFNGTLNWLGSCNINSDACEWDDTIATAQLVIVLFDLGMETYSQLLLPHLDESLHAEPTIGVLMDCLCFYHDCMRTHFVIWQMKDFGVEKSWTQFMKVSYQDLQIDGLCFPLLPLCMPDNGDVLIMATVSAEMQAILYHRRDNRVELTELPKYVFWGTTMDYVESLVSPRCN